MEELIELLKARNLTVASCESFTGGLFASLLTEVPGASSVFKGSVVSYVNEIKIRVVNVPSELIETYGAVSEETASAMAKNTRQLMKSDYCISFTGNAGPSVLEGKAAGSVYMAICGKTATRVYHDTLQCDRHEVRSQSVELGVIRLKEFIRDFG